ncbi:MAG: 23S rRNA (uracil(1939)-C(5))-methyltransferase RlmD [Ruminococcus sp.]
MSKSLGGDGMFKKNDIINLKIDALTSEGSGVGRSEEGIAVFVPDSAVGDELTVKILKVKKTHAFGKIENIVKSSADRIKPQCPVSRQCGGCVYNHISYEAELRAKEQRVKDAIKRIGGIDTQVNAIIGAESECRYRNKAQIPFGRDKDGKVTMGFFFRHSHRIVGNGDCLLQPESFFIVANALRAFIEEKGISVYDEEKHKGLIRHLYLRYGEKTDELMVCIVINGSIVPCEDELTELLRAEAPNIKSIIVNSNKEKTNVVLGKSFRTVYGEDNITDVLCGLKFYLSPQSFYQVNRKQAEKLYSLTRDFAGLKEDDVLVDLYCGTGTIGLTMARDCKCLVGVEIVPEAIEDAKKNAELNGIGNARFICGDAAEGALRLKAEGLAPNVIVIDPPRKGCDAELLSTIVKMNPERIVYVSCDPATLARDLKILCADGYTCEIITPVDMFPRTAHVETVALLSRESVEHCMKIHAEPFEMIKSGRKTIELRLWDEKRKKIKNGDTIMFTNTISGEKLQATVLNLHRFPDFEELYKTLPLFKCGYAENEIDTAQASDMEAYYSADEQAKYGVVGIELSSPKLITE